MEDPMTDNTAEGIDRGVEHLQSAANELLFAARSFLDVVEDVVSDRDKLHAMTSSLTEVLAAAGSSFAKAAGRASTASGFKEDEMQRESSGSSEQRVTKIRRITLD